MSGGGIYPGDMVAIVRACCDEQRVAVGAIFTVSAITGGKLRCAYCGAALGAPSLWAQAHPGARMPSGLHLARAPVDWLQKIDGPAAREELETRADLDAILSE